MKVMIDLATADVELQRADGTWEKVEHCRVRVNVDKALLTGEFAAVLARDVISEAMESIRKAGAMEVDGSEHSAAYHLATTTQPPIRSVRPEIPPRYNRG